MLDGYIIERIRKQREAAETDRAPLRISIPQPPDDVSPGRTPEPRREADEERGIVEVDFSI